MQIPTPKNEFCVFQMLEAKTGNRSEPFTSTTGKLAEKLNKGEDKEEIMDDYVMVLMTMGDLSAGVTDYREYADKGRWSRRPLLTVRRFIETYGENNNVT